MHRPSDRDVNWMSPVQGKSPLVQVKEPYGNFDMVTCRLSSGDPKMRKGLLFAKRSFIFAKRTFIMAKTIYLDCV